MFALVTEAALRSGVLLALVLAVCGALSRSAPALRHGALALALLGSLAMPGLLIVGPEWQVNLPLHRASAAPLQAWSADAAAASLPVGASLFASLWGRGAGLAEAASLVWLAGSALLLLRIAHGIRAVLHLSRTTRGDARLFPTGGRARVAVAPRVAIPLAAGFFRPLVLLPGDARNWSGAKRRAALAHEFAHVRRGDAWALLLAALARALYWPNPLVWIAARALRQYSEEACDATAARTVGALDYADVLLDLARRQSDAPSFATAMAHPSSLERRVRALLRPADRRPPRGGLPALAGVVLVALVGTATLHVAPVPAPASAWASRYGIAPDLAQRILSAAAAEKVEPAVAFGLVAVESGFDADRVSDGGAVGLTQILPSTASVLAHGAQPRLHDADTNLRLGFTLLRQYLDRYGGDTERALLAYRFGPRTVDEGRPLPSDYPARVLDTRSRARAD